MSVPAAAVGRARILVVDDEMGPRESLRMLLKPSYTIATADGGRSALAQIPDGAGLWPLTVAQAVSVPVVVALAVVVRAEWLPRGRTVRWALLAGPIAAVATASFLLSTQLGLLTVSGVLASLYPATTVLLAALVLHERIHRAQGLGLGLCAVAVALVAAG